MADLIWSDAGAGFPPTGPPTAASALGQLLVEVPDPNLDWPGPDFATSEAAWKQWLSDGVEQFYHRIVTNAKSGGRGKAGIPRDHMVIRQYLTSNAGTMTGGVTDMTLPADCHEFLEMVLYPGQAAEVVAVERPFAWDYRIKAYPAIYGPSLTRPIIAITPTGGLRVYLVGPPVASTTFALKYLRNPKGVYNDSGTWRVDAAELRGPRHYFRARWQASRDIDPTPDLQEFEQAILAALPPEPERAAAGGAA